ncbi:MAG: Asp-tRNA(Asn)/Glu-tRNA(Gln) amidotransferase subunit GatB [Chitinivibrionia bacterium]|nr:Asp-tRNA(Asn)/Glu-tRNA(Gln) amidotransferase subunit GatB [Chitinivibrionia bacterium]
MKFETVIGLEIHAQLKTKTKIFCGCKTSFGDEPNTHSCPVCQGLPGALPVLNREVVKKAIRAGLATNHTIRKESVFARKNYFYPDLPKGYQISQFELPICEKGYLDIVADGNKKRVGITRIHLEEDAGKLIHDQDIDSLFDANRCGTPLIEIVSEPDMRSSEEAYQYLTGLKKILQYLDVCDCNMEEGSLRCDANVSIRPFGETKLGTKAELKNMNSFSNVKKAIDYEVERQTELIENGKIVVQQTFLWDANKNITIAMRSKESSDDYRYFPDPDLTTLIVTDKMIDEQKDTLPELPKDKEKRFSEQYSLDNDAIAVLTETIEIADYYEKTAKLCGNAKSASGWILTDILKILKEKQCELGELKTTSEKLAEIIKLVQTDKISASAGKKILAAVEETGKEPQTLVEELGLSQVSDSGELKTIMEKIFSENPAEVERFKSGDNKLTSFFVGQAMKESKGKANPKEINRIIGELINS